MRNLVSSALTTRYKNNLSAARTYELSGHDVILCTCSAASAASLEQLNVRQIIIDECAMSIEPETLIPLVSHHHAEKVSPKDEFLGQLLRALEPLHVFHPLPCCSSKFNQDL